MTDWAPFFTPPLWSELKAQFAALHGWQARQKALLQLAREMPPFPAHWQNDNTRVHGCEVSVFVHLDPSAKPLCWSAWSPSRVVTGQLRVLQSRACALPPDQRSPEVVLAAFGELGLADRLPTSRRSGLLAVLTRALSPVNQRPDA